MVYNRSFLFRCPGGERPARRTPWPMRIVAALLLAAPFAGAQQGIPLKDPVEHFCSKPTVPPFGFGLRHSYDNPFTYEDGYNTLCDLAYPDAPVPECGWPLVMLVHGLPGSRLNQRRRADDIAKHGYAVWVYEMRGQVQSIPLNPPTEGFAFYGAVEKYDLAEQIYWAREAFPSIVHPEKVAVCGSSQGGIHGWFAAAYSERTVTDPDRGTIAFPKIDCVAPTNFNAEFHEHFLRDRSSFSPRAIIDAFNPDGPNIIKDPAYSAQVQGAFLSQTPKQLSNAWNLEVDRLWGPKLFTTTVPVFWAHAHLDGAQAPKPALEWIDQMDPSTPVRVMISTGGHLSPINEQEDFVRRDLRIRWFDRWLWGVANNVEHEDGFDLAPLPLDPNDLNDQLYPWHHRRYPSRSEPTGTTKTTYYMDSTGSLTTTQPPSGPSFTLQHIVAPGFDAATWAATPTVLTSTVLNSIPLSEIVYTSTPFATEVELAGRPLVNLWVAANNKNYQLAAVLEAVLPNGQSSMLCAWGKGLLNASLGVPVNVKIGLPPVAAVLPAGSYLRLNIRNHWMLEPPMSGLEAVPYFETATTLVLHGPPGGQQSTIELPFRPVGLSLRSSMYEMATQAPELMTILIDGGTGRAGDPYAILVGVSGQVPGTPVPGGKTMPVTMDTVTSQIQQLSQSGSPFVTGLVGVLDAQGSATATIDWTGLPQLASEIAGKRVILAAWSPGAGTASVSNSIQFVAH